MRSSTNIFREIRALLHHAFVTDRAALIYRFLSETAPVKPMRLKIEINNGEHFTVFDLQRKKIQAKNAWFTGEAEPLTYQVEELLGTKLRALYQRKKGRDLFDMGTALKHFPKLNMNHVVQCFTRYMTLEEAQIPRAQFEENLAGKLRDLSFTQDIGPLLSIDSPAFDAQVEGEKVKSAFLSLLPGEPWKGNESKREKSRKNS